MIFELVTFCNCVNCANGMHSFWKAVTLKFRPDDIPVGMYVTEARAPLYFLGTWEVQNKWITP